MESSFRSSRVHLYCIVLLQSKFMKDLSVDLDKTGEILHFLDAGVIKLEGGSELDLTILDTAEEPPRELGDVGKPKGGVRGMICFVAFQLILKSGGSH